MKHTIWWGAQYMKFTSQAASQAQRDPLGWFFWSGEVPLEEPTFEHVPDALDVIDGPRGLFIFNSWMSLASHWQVMAQIFSWPKNFWRKNVRRNLARNLTWIWKGFFFTNLNMNLSFLGYTATALGKHIVEIIWVAWGLWNQELHCNKCTNHQNYGNYGVTIYGIPSFVDPWFMDPSNCFLHPSGQEILYHLGLKMG